MRVAVTCLLPRVGVTRLSPRLAVTYMSMRVQVTTGIDVDIQHSEREFEDAATASDHAKIALQKMFEDPAIAYDASPAFSFGKECSETVFVSDDIEITIS